MNRTGVQPSEDGGSRRFVAGIGNIEAIGFGYQAKVSKAGNQLQLNMRKVSAAVKVTDVFSVADGCALDRLFVVGAF
jgi:enoyl-[acyl-carrier-protein] reductase (NADH)